MTIANLEGMKNLRFASVGIAIALVLQFWAALKVL